MYVQAFAMIRPDDSSYPCVGPARSAILGASLLSIAFVLCATAVAAQSGSRVPASPGGAGAPRRAPLAVLASDLQQIISDRSFAEASWGASVVSCDNGEVLYDFEAGKNRQFASNLKLLSTATALAALGADRRFATEVYLGNVLDAGDDSEDLVIRALGDPSISPSFGIDPREVLHEWVSTIDSLGVRRIRNIIVDASRYEATPFGPGWGWDDEAYGFNAHISAAAIYDNSVEVRVTPGPRPGSPARIDLLPATAYVTLQVTAQTATRDAVGTIEVKRDRGSDIVTVSGSIAVGAEPYIEHIAVDDPNVFFGTLIEEELERSGIPVRGAVLDAEDIRRPVPYATLRRISVRRSRPLGELLPAINKQSLNLATEMLVREMGFDDCGIGSTSAGLEVVRRFMRDAGIDPEKTRIVDGSGLSRLNMLSAADMTRLLRVAWRARWGADFRASLAIAGRDGTLATRMRGSLAEGNAIGKTGYLNGIRALSGYVRSRDGEWLAFSIVVNNYSVPTSVVNTAQDLFVMRLASFSRKTL